MLMLLLLVLICCLLTGSGVLGNTEKTIFVAPEATRLSTGASIDNLLLVSLNPDYLTARTYLNASFPTTADPKGTESWLLLENLSPGQRYEVRVCWLATQPTSFWLYTHSISHAFETSSLITSLSSYAYKRHAVLEQVDLESLQARRSGPGAPTIMSSLLLLQIYAAADYFSLDETLMTHVPPVHVDIILDPYLYNIFPQSLVPTAVYISLIAIGAWFLSAWIARRLRRVASGSIATQTTSPEIDREKKAK